MYIFIENTLCLCWDRAVLLAPYAHIRKVRFFFFFCMRNYPFVACNDILRIVKCTYMLRMTPFLLMGVVDVHTCLFFLVIFIIFYYSRLICHCDALQNIGQEMRVCVLCTVRTDTAIQASRYALSVCVQFFLFFNVIIFLLQLCIHQCIQDEHCCFKKISHWIHTYIYWLVGKRKARKP